MSNFERINDKNNFFSFLTCLGGPFKILNCSPFQIGKLILKRIVSLKNRTKTKKNSKVTF